MNNENAIKVLIQAVQLAQAKGAFTLDDAVVVKQAIDVFIKPQEVEPPQGTGRAPDIKKDSSVKKES